MSHLSREKKIQRRLTALGLILLVVVLAVAAFTYAPQASERTTLENQATVVYCDEADTTETCNPDADIFSYSGSSNLVTTQLTSAAPVSNTICISGLTLSNRRQDAQNHAKIQVSILTPDSATAVAEVTDATSDATGQLFVTVPNLEATTRYDIKVKPAGYLAVRLRDITDIYQGCHSIAPDRSLAEGDFVGNDNEIKLADISAAIAARNSDAPGDIFLAAYPDTNGKPSLQSISRIINSYVHARRGDD